MANTQQAFGLRPVRYLNGTPWNGMSRPYYCRSNYATALYVGDPVVIMGEANTAEFQGWPIGTLSTINLGAAGDGVAITGVITGFVPVTNASLVYRPASTEQIAMVCDDPNVVFQIQDDGAATSGWDEWIGLNANLISGSGSTSTGQSGWALDGVSDPPDADASNQLLILGLSAMVGTNDLADYATWDVLINQHTYKPASGLGIA